VSNTLIHASAFNDIASLRARTLSNNIVWLESLGCSVSRDGGIVNVDHPILREFKACLVVSDHSENLSQLKSIVAETAGDPEKAKNIYLDESTVNNSLREFLDEAGFKPILSSIVTVVAVGQGSLSTEISLERAPYSERENWFAMYAEGFDRNKDASIEERLRRWGNAFDSAHVENWFFVERGQRIGVCQTCTANGLVGLYSFTLIPQHRRIRKLLMSVRSLRAKLLADGVDLAYFERVQGIGLPHRRVMPLKRFAAIREFTVYHRIP